MVDKAQALATIHAGRAPTLPSRQVRRRAALLAAKRHHQKTKRKVEA